MLEPSPRRKLDARVGCTGRKMSVRTMLAVHGYNFALGSRSNLIPRLRLRLVERSRHPTPGTQPGIGSLISRIALSNHDGDYDHAA
jgi:hypothetical protein